jgi:hypothetical protein
MFVCESLSINFWKPGPAFMKLDMYIMARKSISEADYINPSHESVCLYVYPLLSLLGKGSETVAYTNITRPLENNMH